MGLKEYMGQKCKSFYLFCKEGKGRSWSTLYAVLRGKISYRSITIGTFEDLRDYLELNTIDEVISMLQEDIKGIKMEVVTDAKED